jgi:predicted metal-binding membrane protein
MEVDLRLAVNYLPACACLCKVLIFMLLLGIVPPGNEVRGGYIQIAAMLYIDRLVTRNIIFDANAILMAIYFANVHAAVRATGSRPAYTMVLWALNLWWAGMCITLVLEPAQVKKFLEKRVQVSRMGPVVFTMAVLVATAYMHSPLEDPPVRACRALAFTLLAFAWIYVVGIHTQHGIEYLKETSSLFIVRLAPVLYSPIWLATLFCPAVLAALMTQYARRSATDSQLVQVTVQEVVQRPVDSEDDTQLFRQAKFGRSGPLESVPE